ncbi:hypothetical protein TSUD_173960 [Trifolium subterraneum]|nr:hypothetical protein TSUD_173960 [Trifolium subterraneum]
MSQERLNDVAVLCLEKDIIEQVDIKTMGEWEWEFRWKTSLDMLDQDLLFDLIKSLCQASKTTPWDRLHKSCKGLGFLGRVQSDCLFVESVDHLFVSCDRISSVWYRVSRWLGIEYVSPNSIMQVFESFFGLGVGCRVRLGLILVWHDIVWAIRTSQNDIIFVGGSSTIDNIVDRVKLSSWKWFLGKNLDSPCSLYEWEVQPLLCWSSKVR